MKRGSLEARARALEEAFFRRRDAEVRAALREQQDHAEALRALARVCGVEDEALLEPLVARGLQAETAAALLLVPLIAVAWADGRIRDAELLEIEHSAAAFGIAEGSAAAELFHGWLRERPDDALFQAWIECARALAGQLGEDERWTLEELMLGRARAVAAAAGGVPSIGHRGEKHVLELLADAFETV